MVSQPRLAMLAAERTEYGAPMGTTWGSPRPGVKGKYEGDMPGRCDGKLTSMTRMTVKKLEKKAAAVYLKCPMKYTSTRNSVGMAMSMGKSEAVLAK